MFEETSTIITSLDRLHSSAAAIARGADHRAELASIELAEARDRAVEISVLLVVGAIVALLAGFALNFFLAALWWDTPHRTLALGLQTGVQAVIAAIAISIGIGRIRRWRPLAQTVEQLKKDSQCLRDLLNNPRD